MLSRMLPEQVSDQWEAVRPGIEDALPYTVTEHNMNKLLAEFMSGNMHCWVLTSDDGSEVYAIITTMFRRDMMERKVLVIFSIYSYTNTVPFMDWQKSFLSLGKWAKSQGCDEIVAQVNNVVSARLAKHFGATAVRSLISVDLNNREDI